MTMKSQSLRDLILQPVFEDLAVLNNLALAMSGNNSNKIFWLRKKEAGAEVEVQLLT